MKPRSDLDIQSDVLEELHWTANVKANEIGIAVKEGVVTLTGTVESYPGSANCPGCSSADSRSTWGRERDHGTAAHVGRAHRQRFGVWRW